MTDFLRSVRLLQRRRVGVVADGVNARDLEPFEQRQSHRAGANHTDLFHVYSCAGRKAKRYPLSSILKEAGG